MTHWVGLTGGIGSGKSTVARLFTEYSIPIVDTDRIAHQITTHHGRAVEQLRTAFGEQSIDSTGSLRRSWMRAQIVANSQIKQKLEQILHPIIIDEVCVQQRNQQRVAYGLIAIPLLVENPHFQNLVERVLLVDCDEETQITRIMARNQFSRKEALAILSIQASREERRKIAHDIITNQEDFSALRQQVEQFHYFYLKRFNS